MVHQFSAAVLEPAVFLALPVLHDAVVRSAAAVSAAEATLLHVTLAAAQLSKRRQGSLHDLERQPRPLQIETPASEPGIPAEVFHRSVP